MKVFIVLAAFAVAVASAGRPAYGPAGGYGGAISTGHSTQFRQEDNYGNYNFGYDESHATGGSSRREEQTNGVRRGSYSLSDADGRQRTVNYVADHTGFRASVHTNEPGVEPKDPADVLINKEGHAYGPGPAPLAVAGPAYGPAPVAIAAPAPAYGPGPIAVAPAPVAIAAPVKGYHSGPVAVAGPAYGPGPVYEAPAPRAFSYSFGAHHVAPAHVPAPVYAPAPAYAAPVHAPVAAPVYQERLGY